MPAVGRDTLGELSLHGAFRCEALDDGGGEGVMHDPIGVGHGGHLAGEMVPARVQGGDLFAFCGSGTGGTTGVPAIGCEFFRKSSGFAIYQ